MRRQRGAGIHREAPQAAGGHFYGGTEEAETMKRRKDKSPGSGTNKRDSGGRKRELSELQRKAIRLLVGEPGITLQEVANRLQMDRTSVSHWYNRDKIFQEALEEARSAPRPVMSAEAILEALPTMSAGQRAAVAAALGVRGNGKRDWQHVLVGGVEVDMRRYGESELKALHTKVLQAHGEREQDELIRGIYAELCAAGSRAGYPGFSGGGMTNPKEALLHLLDEERSHLEEVGEDLRTFFDDQDSDGAKIPGVADAGDQARDLAFQQTADGRTIARLREDIEERAREIMWLWGGGDDSASYQSERDTRAEDEEVGEEAGGEPIDF